MSDHDEQEQTRLRPAVILQRIAIWVVGLIVAFLTLNPSVIFALTVGTALSGVLVRYRVHYDERSDVETKMPLQTEGVTSYLRVLRRVIQVEGRKGLFKGAVPTAFVVLTWRIIPYFLPWHSFEALFWRRMPDGIWGDICGQLVWLIVSVPLLLVVNREVTASVSLNWMSPLVAVKSLFTDSERAQPSVLLSPLFSITVAEILRIFAIYGTDEAVRIGGELVQKRFLSDIDFNKFDPWDNRREFAIIVGSMALFWAFKLIIAMVICPLEVAIVRLSCQRYSTDGDKGSNEVPVPDLLEPVIQPRATPYTGLLNCLSAIVREERWKSLLRALWATWLFTMNAAMWESMVYRHR